MTAYYNEIDPYAAQWLRNLIKAGHIAPGDVDERSIVDLRADDFRNYTQCHFFAGIGGWSIALRLADWPDDRPVWTGSCPCQPFSAAGKGKAGDDERHLWPAWFPLIAKCRPPIVFGEQVEAAVGWGWVDAVFSDLEGEGYACGAAVLPACGVGAPHIRQRCWFVADANGGDASTEGLQRGGEHRQQPQDCGSCRGRGWVLPSFSANFFVPCERCHATGVVGNTPINGSGALYGQSRPRTEPSEPIGGPGFSAPLVNPEGEQAGLSRRTRQPRTTYWSDAEWIECADGQSRPIEPDSSPLAHGVRARPSKLRAYGNAIVPQVAAEFIRAFNETTNP